MPDALLARDGESPDPLTKAQCPWCQETLDSSELRAAVPPALVPVGEQAVLSSVAATGDGWGEVDSAVTPRSGLDLHSHAVTEDSQANSELSTEDHAAHSHPFESDASELHSADIDDIPDDGPAELQLQQPVYPQSDSAATPERVIKISVPGKSRSGDGKHSAMMDVDPTHSRRRRRKSSPWKSMVGVVLGGLLALPIVGTILHYATGQHVPYLSDILPGGGATQQQTRANLPMPVQPRVPDSAPAAPQNNEPSRQEIAAPADPSDLVDPADSALQEITGGPANPATQLADTMNGDAPENSSASPSGLPGASPSGSLGGMSVPESELPESSMPEAVPDLSKPATSNAAGAVAENAPTDSGASDASTSPNDAAAGELPGNTRAGTGRAGSAPPASESPATNVFDNSLADSAVPETNPAGPMIPEAPAPQDDLPIDASSADAAMNDTPVDDLALGGGLPPSTGFDASGAADDNTGAGDLFADTSENPFPPRAVAEVSPEDALDVDAEVAELTRSLDEIREMDAAAPGRAEQLDQLYESFSELAGRVPSDSAAKLSPLLDEISSNTSVAAAFAKATPIWIGRTATDRGSEGAVVVGIMSSSGSKSSMTLVDGQKVPVTLPADAPDAPSGIHVGVGRLQGSGSNASITLDLLEIIKR
ncbi:hypothetical protein [Allorhodopirellula solitaria]|uniref:hypothetical protein n=1 Tax=Allorhodopirellula solitaria TaxID=2527987 RepID=UPI0011B3AE4B|nr:hypothetical protein [Allorhodopirellula solitaria]